MRYYYSNMEQEKYQADEEIDLRDYVKALLKRKLLVLAVFLIAVLAGGVFTFISSPVYKIDTVLEIGTVGQKLVEEPAQLVGRIQGDVYGTVIREKLNIAESEYPEIGVESPQGTSLISRTIESDKFKQAKQILEEGNKLVVAEHQEKLELEKQLLEDKIVATQANILVLEADIKRVDSKIVSLQEEKDNLEAKVAALQTVLVYQQDPGTQFALFDTKEKLEAKKQEIENRYLQINSLQVQINNLKDEISKLQKQIQDIRPTSIVRPPTISENPIRPRPLFNLAVAGVLGLFAGAFVALGREWWQKA